ncbi:DUF4837 family protein [Cytophagales bacterium LB-30]|uniref:DUF4837 family protein n=1 Tax=Shiella aurantiaca TaxID=3058365 RepID=A0ABT8F3W5_9BACT|nr:DUF4837 family protein [Shiella aurantiaca]MDN4164691.1 DUF4837 family protein [Shiella aurantiaca]
MKSYLYAIGLVAILAACSTSNSETTSTKPQSRGQLYEVLVVMDSALWKHELGDSLRSVFAPIIPGLPQDEPYLDLRHVNPLGFNDLLKQSRNIIFLATLDQKSAMNRSILNNFSANSLQIIKEDTTRFMMVKKDDFAKGQTVLYLFGQNSEILMRHLAKNPKGLRDVVLKGEKERVFDALYNNKEQTGLQEELTNKFGGFVRIPNGYKVADNQSDFVWLRHPEKEVDRNIFMAVKPYTNEAAFHPDSIIAWREQITKKYIYGDPENKESYVTIQKVVPPVSQILNDVEVYTVETRGLWQTNTISMGGPFISHVLVDKQAGTMYYIEGFVYAPSKDKREYMVEMETILRTFKERVQTGA